MGAGLQYNNKLRISLFLNALFFLILGLFSNCGSMFSSKEETTSIHLEDYEFLSDDMIVDKESLNTSMGATNKAGYVFGRDSTYWTNGDVPVKFEGLSRRQQNLFYSACFEWSKSGYFSCRPRLSSDARYLLVTNSQPGCFSYYGQSNVSSYTLLNLANVVTVSPAAPEGTCMTKGIIMHEIGHALGMIHEHQRPDRDQYINVLRDNVSSMSNFEKMNAVKMGPYDFVSIMHYSKYNGSKNGRPTLSVRSPYDVEFGDLIGNAVLQSAELSLQDKAFVQQVYGAEQPTQIRLSANRFRALIGETVQLGIVGGTPPYKWMGALENGEKDGIFTAEMQGAAVIAVQDSNGVSSNVINISVSTGTNSCSMGGVTIPHGSSIRAYYQSKAYNGDDCQSQIRVCTDGSLSGSYTNFTCTRIRSGSDR